MEILKITENLHLGQKSQMEADLYSAKSQIDTLTDKVNFLQTNQSKSEIDLSYEIEEERQKNFQLRADLDSKNDEIQGLES